LAIELEKRKKRAERFGIPVVETVKAVVRAQRFGTGNPAKKILDDPTEVKKAKKRAERFGGGGEAKKVKV
jgi:hypothetical protein